MYDAGYKIHDAGYSIQDYSLRIFDVSGQLVKDFSRSTLDALRPTLLTWQCEEPPGVYILRFENKEVSTTLKLIRIE